MFTASFSALRESPSVRLNRPEPNPISVSSISSAVESEMLL